MGERLALRVLGEREQRAGSRVRHRQRVGIEAGDVPSAYGLRKYELRTDFRFHDGGGILGKAYLGIFPRFFLGGAAEMRNAIGSGDIRFHRDDAQLLARLLVLVEDETVPALAIVFLFNFLAAWGEYFTARVLIGGKEELLTWPLGIQRFQQQFQTQWADLSASAIIVSVPIVILFVYVSKYLVSGLTLGGVKG